MGLPRTSGGYVIAFLILCCQGAVQAQNVNGLLSTPYNVRVGKFFPNGIEVQWDYTYSNRMKPEDVIFQVEYKRANESVWSTKTVENDTKTLMSPLQKSAWYQARVKAQKRGDSPSTESPWTSVFLFAMPAEKTMIRNLTTPRDLTGSLLSTTSIHLRWSSLDRPITADDDTYYLIEAESRNDFTDGYEPSQQIRVKSTSFLMDQLRLGSVYRFRVSMHKGERESPPSEWIVIRMPTEAETSALTNMRFAYSDETPGFVNLSWTVPEQMRDYVTGYVLWYSTNRDTDLWSQQYFPGAELHAALTGLAPNSTYFLTVETELAGGRKVESSVLQFRTPPVNPIDNVDVIYSKNISVVRLQWTLKPFADRSAIMGYEMYLTDNYQQPEYEWTRHASRETVYELQNLQHGTRYYVRFRVLNKDGTIVRIPTIYHFASMSNTASTKEHAITLTYQRISPGLIKLRWRFPSDIDEKHVTESFVLYTNEPNRPDAEWMKIMVPGARREIALTGISPQNQYYVKILPRVRGSTMDTYDRSENSSDPSVFVLNPTGERELNVTSEIVVATRISALELGQSRNNGLEKRGGDERDRDRDNQGQGGATSESIDSDQSDHATLCMTKCRHESTEEDTRSGKDWKQKRQSGMAQGCAVNERCILIQEDSAIGYCIPVSLVNAVRNYTLK